MQCQTLLMQLVSVILCKFVGIQVDFSVLGSWFCALQTAVLQIIAVADETYSRLSVFQA